MDSSDQHSLKSFVIQHFNLTEIPPQEQDKIVEQIAQLEEEVVVDFILDKLSDEESLIFLRLIENEEDSKALEFAQSKIPEFDKQIAEYIQTSLQSLEV